MSKIVLVDCDGVLLNWRDPFNVWLQENNFMGDTWDEEEYVFEHHLNIDKKYAYDLVKIFNSTYHIENLPPIHGAVKAIKRLHEEGYILKVSTAFSDNYESMKMRERNLINIFGDIFYEISAVPARTNKTSFLSKQPKDSIFIDDLEDHLKDASDLSFEFNNLFLFQQTYNFNSKKFNRGNWDYILRKILGE